MDLRVFLKLDGSGFTQGLTRVRQAVGHFSSGLKSQIAGAFTVGAITYGIKRMLDFSDTIEETAQRIGVGTTALQEWTFAAKQAGVTTEKLQGFIERLSVGASDSAKRKFFDAIGVNPNQTPESLFRSVQARTQGKSSAEIFQMLAPIIGDFRQIGPVINLLKSDLEGAADMAHKLGAVIDESTIHRLATLNDQLSIVSQILMGNFAPALISAAKVALVAFSALRGGAGWLGARTAGLSAKNWLEIGAASMFGPVATVLQFVQRQNEADKKWPSMKDAAQTELDNERVRLTAVLDNLKNYVAPINPAIVAGGESDAVKKAKGAAVGGNSDALIAVGNFLGAGRANIDSVARETNRILKEHTTYLRQIAMKNATLDIGVPN